MADFQRLMKTFAQGGKKVKNPGTMPKGEQDRDGAGAHRGIMDSINSFDPGSRRPDQTAEDEEARTNRRANRGIMQNMRNQRTAGRFNNIFRSQE